MRTYSKNTMKFYLSLLQNKHISLGRQLTIEESLAGVFSYSRKRKTPDIRPPPSQRVDLTNTDSDSDVEPPQPKKPRQSLRQLARKLCQICNLCTTECQW